MNNSTLPTELKMGDLVIYTYKGEDEIVEIVGPDLSFRVLAYGKLNKSAPPCRASKTNAWGMLERWARFGGRHVSQFACSNPQAARTVPQCIYRVTYFGRMGQTIKSAEPFPKELAAVWNQATEAERTRAVRYHVKLLYDMSHTRAISEKSPNLDKLVERRVSLPFGAPFSTKL